MGELSELHRSTVPRSRGEVRSPSAGAEGERTSPARPRIPRPTWSVVVVVAVLAGVGTHQWDHARERKLQEAQVSLVLMPSAGGYTGGSDGQSIRVSGRVTVTNAGPLPVQLRGLHSSPASMFVLASGAVRLSIAAGRSATVRVSVRGPCGKLPRAVPVRADVSTADGVVRHSRVQMPVATTAWDVLSDPTCV
jgi:hypothetical protein